MDLKGTTNLDPKLKATYERVMGTSFTPAKPPDQPSTQSSLNSNQPQSPAQDDIPLQPPPVRPVQQVTEVEQTHSPEPVSAPVSDPLPPSEPVIASPATAKSDSGPEMVQSPQIFSTVNPFQETVPPPGEVLANNAVVPGKKTNQLVLVGLVTGAIVFFVVYAFIWAKVFGLF